MSWKEKKMVLPGFLWVQAKPSAMEKDHCFEVFVVSVAASSGANGFDFAVKALRRCIGDEVLGVGHHIIQMRLDHLGHFDDGIQLAFCRPLVPTFEKSSGPPGFVITPQVS